MAEGFRPRPPSTEADLARRVESGPERKREVRDTYPCPAESVPVGDTRGAIFASGGETPVVMDVVVGDMDGSLPSRRLCPLLPAIERLVQGQIGPGEEVLAENCLACYHGMLGETRSQPSLPPASED